MTTQTLRQRMEAVTGEATACSFRLPDNMYPMTFSCPSQRATSVHANHSATRLSGLSFLSIMLTYYSVPRQHRGSVETSLRPSGCCRSLLVHDSSAKQYRHYDSSGGSNDAVAKKLASQLARPAHFLPIGALPYWKSSCAYLGIHTCELLAVMLRLQHLPCLR